MMMIVIITIIMIIIIIIIIVSITFFTIESGLVRNSFKFVTYVPC